MLVGVDQSPCTLFRQYHRHPLLPFKVHYILLIFYAIGMCSKHSNGHGFVDMGVPYSGRTSGVT